MRTYLISGAIVFGVLASGAAVKAQTNTFDIQGGKFRSAGTLLECSSLVAIPREEAGKRKHQTIVIRKEIDKASPMLLQAATTNEVLKTVTFKVYQPNSKTKYKIIVLKGVTIAKISPAGAPTGAGRASLEEITFVFQTITVTYYIGATTSTDDWIG